ncbi:uncharacterized protein N7515_004405 [Penicillium bovifimosum]|uniref:Uncharacterized protein n=1 Tax=Penicillium bovifimosum TaxID=126998 RepID=A0A9W9H025_9EURO|nr:uncharacterized protein N7515_004405 [Penicillium bovifimosum]KAJ5135127.1 hypothetical protein N7515_004405 [Penicillium bovifimosum]
MPKPLWKWRYEQKEDFLLFLYRGLSHLRPGYISNKLQGFDIHPMDFWTGDTNPSFISYFFPDTETTSKIANTNVNPQDPVDDPFTWARRMKSFEGSDSDEMHHALYAAFAKYLRKSPGGKHQSAWWDPVPTDEEKSLFNGNDRHSFTVQSGARCADAKSSHQLVVMKSNQLHHETLPSIGEVVVLLRWMLDATRKHKHLLGRHSRQGQKQHDFPTMVISFLPDARVRILHGYLDNSDCLQLAYTRALDFDTEDYAEKMDILLQWAWPEVQGDTTKPIPLPLVDEEEDEWMKSGKMELLSAEYSDEESDSGLLSDSDDIWTSTEDDYDSSSDWESVTDANEVDACDQVPIGGCGR